MSKRVFIATLLSFSFVALVFLGPKLLDIDTFRTKVAEIISEKSGWQVDAAQLDWYWLPIPHFSLHNATITRNNIHLLLPETRIFPLWHSLLSQQIELREVKLIKPELMIDAFGAKLDGNEFVLPKAQITVIDGTITLNKGPFDRLSHIFPLTANQVDASIRLARNRYEFELSGESPLFNFLNLEGFVNPENMDYDIEYEVTALHFYNLIPALDDKRVLPVRSAISLQGKLDGRGKDLLHASLIGDFPCFVAPSEKNSFLLDCGSAELEINKDSDDLVIEIKSLQLKNPAATLNGKIARFSGDKDPSTDREPIWLVNLTGHDLDLTAVRKGLLTVWGNNKIVQTVSNIVLGGRAFRASYHFKAPFSGFKDITEMKINVDVEEAEIHPPHTPLYLQKAEGFIEINKGYLSGQGLSARMNSNRGDNCTLFLDLAERQNDFVLDLDLDADLADLKEVLGEIVPHQGFRRETKRFDNVEGRATGHLHIGKTLDNPEVKVRVDTINGGATYEPVPHPIRIRSGKVEVLPNRVVWQGIKGIVGPHLIREFSGETSLTDPLSIEIKSAQATFDSKILLSELRRSSILPEKISEAVSRAEGIVELNRASASGPFKKPSEWRYSLDISTSGSRWTSPLLPQPLLAERVRGEINQDRINLESGKIWFLEQPLLIEGSFSHSEFGNWQTQIMLSGTIRDQLAEWIREKGWIPDEYFPVIPCTLDKFRIDWDDKKMKLSGGIAAGTGNITSPFVRLQLENDESLLKIDNLTISSPEEQGALHLEYLKTDSRRFRAGWQGFVDSSTVRKLLPKNILPAERVEGDFTIKHSTKPPRTIFNGWAKVKDLAWLFNRKRHDFLINELDIVGNEERIYKINRAAITAGRENLTVNGRISLTPTKTTFDLGLETEKLSAQTGKHILADIEGEPAENKADTGEIIVKPEDEQLEGVLHFKAGLFKSDPEKGNKGKEAPDSFTLSPANGFFTVDSSKELYTLDLRNSGLCALDISATLNFKNSRADSSLILFTDSSSPPLFEEVIPCLGFENTLIDGPVYLDVNLSGSGKIWREGNADLYSENGYIHRLSFLSKVFRLINLRDLLSGTDMPDFDKEGFAYSKIEINGRVENNRLYIEKAVIDGEGLNIFGQGSINIEDWTADLTLMVAPLKSVDAVITNIPLIGKVAGGRDKAVISIPVSLKGNLRDPKATILPPEAIGEGFLNLVANTLMMPFQILSPLLPEEIPQQQ